MTFVSSLYVHVPFCRHLCNYCDFYKKKYDPESNQLKEFADYLSASMKRHESIMQQNGFAWAPLETLYFGGGTPSVWGPVGANFFSSLGFSLAENAEVTFEIDPGAWTEETILAWEREGVNRFSVGTQSLDARFIKILDRAHDKEETIKLLRRLQGKNFSVDFLLGVPHSQTFQRDVITELQELLSFEPSHVSLYILNPAAGYSLKQSIPEDGWIADEYLQVSQYLVEQGFHHYEVSNFAKPGRESRHNLRYWNGVSVAALGPTGTGYLAINEDKACRYKWKPSHAEVEIEDLTEKELQLERLYLRLRLDEPFDAAELFPENVQAFDEILGRWQSRGLVEKEGFLWRMKPSAWVVLDSLLNELFVHIPTL